MADEESWWDRIPEPIASIKGNALWSAICVALGSCVNGFFASKILNKPLVVAAYITLVSLGIVFTIGGVISFLKARANKAAIDGMCAALIGDCTYLLRIYQRLDYENRERVRNPLHSSSWPDFGQPWDLFAAELYVARENFTILQLKVRSLWQAAGRKDEPPFLRLPETAVMLDVIGALDELLSTLRDLKR
jgi:hypothetical protein